MKKFRKLALIGAIILSSWTVNISFAEECSSSSGKLAEDAQNVRLMALDMGWEVGKPTSLIAATVIVGKAKIYPRNAVEVCLKELPGALQIRVQSKSGDARKAQWHYIKAIKKRRSLPV